MIRITIKKNGTMTHRGEFEDQALADEWLTKHKNKETFGKEAVYEKQTVLISPAIYEDQEVLVQPEITEEREILDENGDSFDPPQFETVVVQEAVYETQSVMVQEAVYETEQVLIKEAVLDDEGVEIEPAEYETRLKLIDVLISPAEYEIIEEDVTEEVEKKNLIEEKRAKGRKAKDDCLAVLELIGGFNIDRELTFEQKNQMKTLFANAKAALDDFQPAYAKMFILQITPDEVLVTTEMRDLCLELLKDWEVPQA